MASRGLSREDVLLFVFEDDSDFSGSESSIEEGDEVYSYRGPSFSAPSAEAEADRGDPDSDFSVALFWMFSEAVLNVVRLRISLALCSYVYFVYL